MCIRNERRAAAWTGQKAKGLHVRASCACIAPTVWVNLCAPHIKPFNAIVFDALALLPLLVVHNSMVADLEGAAATYAEQPTRQVILPPER